MKMRSLQLETSQMARLRVESQLAGLSIAYKYRRIKEIQQQRAEMSVNRENPSIEVDAESLYNNIGLKNIDALTQDAVSNAYSQAQQGIKATVNNGDFIAALPHRGGNPIAEIARQNLVKVRQPETQSGVIDPTVDIKANPGSFSINWSVQDITISWDDYQAPVITIDPKPYINIELAQEARLEFKVVEQEIPPESGRMIDKEA